MSLITNLIRFLTLFDISVRSCSPCKRCNYFQGASFFASKKNANNSTVLVLTISLTYSNDQWINKVHPKLEIILNVYVFLHICVNFKKVLRHLETELNFRWNWCEIPPRDSQRMYQLFISLTPFCICGSCGTNLWIHFQPSRTTTLWMFFSYPCSVS